MCDVAIAMTKGIPISRNLNLQRATNEARKVLLQTKDWPRTREHMRYWIKGEWALSQNTTADYLNTIAARLMRDPETREFVA